jgi:2-dehydro-3-deoxygalactonokinase
MPIIGVEWTSGQLIAMLLSDEGQCLGEIKTGDGAAGLSPDRFQDIFLARIPPDWLPQARAVYFTGMVTARGGWVETGFAATPAPLTALAAAARTLDLSGLPQLVFLPGLSVGGALPDVMRGEELKLYAAAPDGDALLVLPGRHTKWVEVRDGSVVCFATYMGGETASLLQADSLIGRLIPSSAPMSQTGFRRGIEAALNHNLPGGLLRRLFSARSLVLFEAMAASEIAGYIAGLTTGAELLEAQAEWPLHDLPIQLLGNGDAITRYGEALALMGYKSTPVAANTGPVFARIHVDRTSVNFQEVPHRSTAV